MEETIAEKPVVMKLLELFSDLQSLNFGDKIYAIENGKLKSYAFVASHPLENDLVIVAKHDSHMECRVVTPGNLHRGLFYTGDYDSKIAGDAMVKQLNDEIATVTKIYLKEPEGVKAG